MSMTRRRAAWAAIAIPFVACLALAPHAGAGAKSTLFSIDVACDATSFAFQGPAGMAGPDYGASFVVQGLIYPAHTFAVHGATSGILATGEAEFPELVIGVWTCRGWFLGDGIATVSGPFVATTQIYGFEGATLISEGIELIDLDVPFDRALTGGTGRFKAARGQVTQRSVGTNATGLFNFTFDFDL